jgi:hypothetical protein
MSAAPCSVILIDVPPKMSIPTGRRRLAKSSHSAFQVTQPLMSLHASRILGPRDKCKSRALPYSKGEMLTRLGQSGRPLQNKHRTYETKPWPDLAYMPRWALAPDRFRVLAGLTPGASACCLLAKPLGFGAGDIEASRCRSDGQGVGSVLRDGQENANIRAELGFGWRILC